MAGHSAERHDAPGNLQGLQGLSYHPVSIEDDPRVARVCSALIIAIALCPLVLGLVAAVAKFGLF